MNNNDTHSDVHKEGMLETSNVSSGDSEHDGEVTTHADQHVTESHVQDTSPDVRTEHKRHKTLKRDRNFISILWEISAKYIILLVAVLATAVASFFVFFTPTKSVSVPNVVGKDFIDASMLLQERGLYVKIAQQFTSDPSDIGKVITQSPQAGVFIRANRSVLVTVSKGTVVSEVPDLIGVSLQRANDMIYGQFSGFYKLLEINTINKIFSEESPGSIIGQFPLPGTKISNVGTQIDLVVSRGMVDNYESMIDVEGLYFDDIFDYLSNVGVEFEFYISEFSVPASIERQQETLPSGIILEQAPVANTPLTEEIILRIGVRGATIQNNDVTSDATVPARDNSSVQILFIPMNNVTGPVVIRKIVGEESTDILRVQSYSNTITIPYRVIPDEAYEAITATGVTFWRYNNTAQRNSE